MNIKFIEDEEIQLVYFGETARFFAINSRTKSLIEDIINQVPEKSLLKDYSLTPQQLQQFKQKLVNYDTSPTILAQDNTSLDKLIINISNTCNLRCKYCYAHHGAYGSTSGLMTKEMAKTILDRFYNHFNSIGVIQLFGGEPTLNIPVMKFICKYISVKNKSLDLATAIGFVTNGTILTSELIDLIKQYNLQVTVSYDGNPLVNDCTRIFENGCYTSDIILKNIKTLKMETNQPTTIEVTLSEEHLKHHITPMLIMKHIRSEIGDISVHIAPASGSHHCALTNFDCFIESIDDILGSVDPDKYTYTMIEKAITALVTKKFEHDFICQAGIQTLSVSMNGDVFPCFTFTDDEKLYMGNVFNEDLFDSKNFSNVQNKFINFSKSLNETCKSCFSKRVCIGCLGCHYLETGSPFILNKSFCEMNRKMTEKLILSIYKTKVLNKH